MGYVVGGKYRYIGRFGTVEEAAQAYAEEVLIWHSCEATKVGELMRVLGVSQIQIAQECGCGQSCLSQWLRGMDMHRQSVIAAGEAAIRWSKANKARATADSECDAAHTDDTSWYGEKLVGARVSVRWEVEDHGEWFQGTVVRFDAAASRCGAHQIEYDCDHKRHWSLLNQMEVGEVGGNAEWAVLQMPGDVMSVGSAGEAARMLRSVTMARGGADTGKGDAGAIGDAIDLECEATCSGAGDGIRAAAERALEPEVAAGCIGIDAPVDLSLWRSSQNETGYKGVARHGRRYEAKIKTGEAEPGFIYLSCIYGRAACAVISKPLWSVWQEGSNGT